MVLSLLAVTALAAQCAPSVAPQTLLAVVQVESGFDPLAIGVNGPRRAQLHPGTIEEATTTAERLIGQGLSVDLGLGQINSKNLSALALTVSDAFNACRNLAASARVLADGYQRFAPGPGQEQAAIQTSLSLYNTGDPGRGFRNGYVGKVMSAAGRIVPALDEASLAGLPGSSPARPPEIPSPAWDVFGEVHRDRGSFVTTVSITASGGSQ
jgi:type IV secretion system protein VirB1